MFWIALPWTFLTCLLRACFLGKSLLQNEHAYFSFILCTSLMCLAKYLELANVFSQPSRLQQKSLWPSCMIFKWLSRVFWKGKKVSHTLHWYFFVTLPFWHFSSWIFRLHFLKNCFPHVPHIFKVWVSSWLTLLAWVENILSQSLHLKVSMFVPFEIPWITSKWPLKSSFVEKLCSQTSHLKGLVCLFSCRVLNNFDLKVFSQYWHCNDSFNFEAIFNTTGGIFLLDFTISQNNSARGARLLGLTRRLCQLHLNFKYPDWKAFQLATICSVLAHVLSPLHQERNWNVVCSSVLSSSFPQTLVSVASHQ